MFKKFVYSHDWIITSISFLILLIGLTTIYSTSIYSKTDDHFAKQVIFSIAGIFIYFVISNIDFSYLKYKPVIGLIYGMNILFLLLELIIGQNIRGAARWLSFGAVNFQPSELTKIVLILTISSVLTMMTGFSEKKLFLLTLILFLPLALLVFKEPSLSATVVLIVTWISIFFFNSNKQIEYILISILFLIALNTGGTLIMPKILFFPVIKSISTGIILISVFTFIVIASIKILKTKTIIMVLLSGIIVGFACRYVLFNFVWNKVLVNYQKQRITAFLGTDKNNITSAGFQVEQSKIAIGSGELLGKGFAQGTQSYLNFLPDHYTDFIFASFSEEFGLLGDAILLFLFSILYFRIIKIAETITDKFGNLVITGIITVLMFQTFVNIGINIGTLPATGIPMPLISYGGSSLWITLIMLGLVQSIYRKSLDKKWLEIEI